MSQPNRLVRYGWLSVFYRQAARKSGFLDKDGSERWHLLREEILPGSRKGGLHLKAFDAVPPSLRTNILAWLQGREQRAASQRFRSSQQSRRS